MSDYPAQDVRVEPDTQADTDDGHSLHSIAISLKRIADVLEGSRIWSDDSSFAIHVITEPRT